MVYVPEEDRATVIGNMHKKLVKIARVVSEISCHTDRQTDRQAGGFLRPDCALSSERPQFADLWSGSAE